MQSKLTEGRVSSHLFKLTLPMIWGILSILAFSLADTYFVAQLGTQELAAISFTFPVVNVLSSVAMGLGIGASSIISRAIGEGDRQKVQQLTTDSLLLSLLIVVLLVVIGLTTIQPVFTALGAGPDIIPLVHDYMSIWYLGMAFIVVPMVGNSAIRASGNTLVPSLIMTFAAGANILLDPALIFGWGPLPALGLKGAAIATALSYGSTLIASLLFLHFRERLLSFQQSHPSQMLANWQSLLQVGVPAIATNLIAPLSVGIVVSLLAGYGAEAVAGFGLASKLESVALIIPISLSASLGPFVGQNWGAQQRGRINRSLRLTAWFCLGWGALVATVLGIKGATIATWFNQSLDVIASAKIYLTIVPISYGALGIVLAASSAFNAMGKPILALGMSLSRLLALYLPLAYLGNWLFGIAGIYGAACLANFIVGFWAWLWHSRWSKLLAEPHLESYPAVTESVLR
ncbi:MAG: MATE family efflux transporter [Cyanobacteria bacterium P01_D01_bin.71]